MFEENGGDAYMELQKERVDIPAAPGSAFALAKKILKFNEGNVNSNKLVEIFILSRNDPFTGLRVFHSIQEHGLKIERGVFTRGKSGFPYLIPFGAHLYLSANSSSVQNAIKMGIPAASVYTKKVIESNDVDDKELRIAFDGDAVLFSDEAERVFQEKGLHSFVKSEVDQAQNPLMPGPFKRFLESLNNLKKSLSPNSEIGIRTALVTARGAPAHERPLRTLLDWGVDIDEAIFLANLPKDQILETFSPDFFFDDKLANCYHTQKATPTGHVNFGIANE